MAKKVLFVLVIGMIAAGGAFAQFSLTGEVGTDFQEVTPGIGIKIGLEKLDILAGFNLGLSSATTKYDPPPAPIYTPYDKSQVVETSSFGFYGGIGIKAAAIEKWSISIPLLAQMTFGASKTTRERSDGTTTTDGPATFQLDFKAGGRAEYAFSEHWGLYTGFLWDMFTWEQSKNKNKTGANPWDTTDTVRFFQTGSVQLGVSYKF